MTKIFKFIIPILFIYSLDGLSQPFFTQNTLSNTIPDDAVIQFNEIVDLDNDGDQDAVFLIFNEGLSWYDDILDENSKTIISNPDFQNISVNFVFKIFDFNNDNHQDLIYWTVDKIKIQENLGNGTFSSPQTLLDLNDPNISNTYSTHVLNIYDFDNDGLNDFVISYQNTVKLFKNLGGSAFSSSDLYNSSVNIEKLLIADFDMDGNNDFVTLTEYGKKIHIHTQTGINTFSSNLISTNLEVNYSHYLDVVDVDGDANLDILVLNMFGSITPFEVGYFKNQGNSTLFNYELITSESSFQFSPQLNFVDLKGNSEKDLIIHSNKPYILENLGNGNFTEKEELKNLITMDYSPQDITEFNYFDYDLDGDLDIMTVNKSPFNTDNTVDFLENFKITTLSIEYDTISTCDSSYTIPSNGSILTNSQNYIDTLTSDSLNVVYVQFNKAISVDISKNICEGGFIEIGDSVYNSTGNYTNVLSNQYGCDSTINLQLTLVPNVVYSDTNIETELCSYVVNHITYYSDTLFTDTLSNVNGCDSIATYQIVFEGETEVNEYEYSKITLGTFIHHPHKLLATDFDMDSDIDLFATSLDDKLVYIENTGDQYYKNHNISTDFLNISQLHSLDYNNDGDGDLLVSFDDNCSLGIIRNDECHFTDLELSACVKGYNLGRLDENELEDIVYIENNTVNILYNGSHKTSFNVSSANLISIADYNNDNLNDIIIYTYNAIQVYLNMSNQNFALAHTISFDSSIQKNLEMIDMDNDGDLDVVYERFNVFDDSYSIKVAFLENNLLKNTTAIRTNKNFLSFKIGKVSDALNNDIIVNHYSPYLNSTDITVYRNNGDKTFIQNKIFNRQSSTYYKQFVDDITIEDIDNDGLDDITYSLNNRNNGSLETSLIAYYNNQGDGTYIQKHISNNNGVNVAVNSGIRQMLTQKGTLTSSYLDNYTIDINLEGGVKLTQRTDMDGQLVSNGGSTQERNNGFYNQVDYDLDGDLDIIVGSIFKLFRVLIENKGSQGFEEHLSINGASDFNYDVDFEDIDLDGFVDMVLDKGLSWRKNLGGTYGPTQDIYTWTKPANSQVLELIDLDNDGDKDIIIGIFPNYFPNLSEIQIFKNIGGNQLSFHSSISTNDYLMTKDFNGDGFLDILLGNEWYNNTGSLSFVTESYPNSITRPQVIKDINGDGFEDVLYKDGNTILWSLDDGSFTYSLEDKIVTNNAGNEICNLNLIDFDLDGDFDIQSLENPENNAFKLRDDLVIYENKAEPLVIEHCDANSNQNKFEWIRKVNFKNGALKNISGKDAGGYGDYSSKTLHVTNGEKISVKLFPKYEAKAKKVYWRVWIDWNNDGDFTDPGEKVFQKKGKNLKKGNFTVPTHTSLQNLKMRIAMRKGSYPKSCGVFGRGEVEDYTVKVTNTSNLKQSQNNQIDLSSDSEEFISAINPITIGQTIVGQIKMTKPGLANISIINVLGQTMSTKSITINDGEITSFELSSNNLTPGLYFISVNHSKEHRFKIIIN